MSISKRFVRKKKIVFKGRQLVLYRGYMKEQLNRFAYLFSEIMGEVYLESLSSENLNEEKPIETKDTNKEKTLLVKPYFGKKTLIVSKFNKERYIESLKSKRHSK